MFECPVCGCSDLSIAFYTTESNTNMYVQLLDTKKNLVLKALISYWKWVAEDKPVHDHDNYHEEIEFLGEHIYKYHIQTFDSPEGDVWIHGKIQVIDNQIKFLEEGSDSGLYT